MSRPAPEIRLSTEEKEILLRWMRSSKTEQRMVERARVILLAASGLSGKEIALRMKTREARISKWLRRFAQDRMAGLSDNVRSGEKRRKYTSLTEERILKALDEPAPPGYSRWNGRLLANRPTKRADADPARAAEVGFAMSVPTEPADEEFDLHLNNGCMLEHFHEGNMTYRAPGIREKVPHAFLEVSPELAAERGIQSGTWVQLISPYGKLRVRALVTDRVQGKELFMPMNSSESPVNLLTSSHTDTVTHTPAYKESSVRMVALPEIGESPLPKVNSRLGHPTPQSGVEVERKWKRADYEMPKGEPVQPAAKRN